MYQDAAVLAALLVAYGAVTGWIERSWFSGPIVFVGAGLVLGPAGVDFLHPNMSAENFRALAEFALAMVLFTDAANADFGVLSRNLGVPERLLLVGLPLTIILGFLTAIILFPGLDRLEAALLAAILAPTDAALGKPVVMNPAVPAATRAALNVESGLNDGICVPIVVILLGFAVGLQIEHGTTVHIILVVLEEIGIGLAVGVGLTWITTQALGLARRRDWMTPRSLAVAMVALPVMCFALAQWIGGSGFIACFAGGLLLSPLSGPAKHELCEAAESVGEVLALMTWAVFGAAVVGQMGGRFTWPVLLYAALSLSIIRMAPVFLCLLGTGTGLSGKLFIGWFGPRGLATIVFGIIVLDEQLPGNDIVEAVAVCTILLSVLAHGVTANPLITVLARRLGTKTGDAQRAAPNG